MGKYNLFLDDIRNPTHCVSYTNNPIYDEIEWVIVRNYNQFVEYITNNGLPELVSFDHDLAEAHYHESMFQDGKVYMKYIETVSEKTGHDCVKWMANYCLDNNKDFPAYLLHTMNPVGKVNMQSYIDSFHKATKCTCDGGNCNCN